MKTQKIKAFNKRPPKKKKKKQKNKKKKNYPPFPCGNPRSASKLAGVPSQGRTTV